MRVREEDTEVVLKKNKYFKIPTSVFWSKIKDTPVAGAT